MSDRREVYIDGVLYVPATSTVANGDALAQAIASVWWGRATTPEERRALWVDVNDGGAGERLDDFMEHLAVALATRDE